MIDRPWIKFIAAFFYLWISYYVCVLFHEWGHGVVAWLFGFKKAFYDIQYGGWLMLRTDENVPYKQLLAEGFGTQVALIAISGLLVSLSLFLVSLVIMNKIKKSPFTYLFFYWIAVVNMLPLIQYLSIQTFSSTGDVGRFTHGLNISPWWIFIPGVFFTAFALYWVLAKALPKAYAILRIGSIWGRQLLLLVTLFVMFLLIYKHGYNPFTDSGAHRGSRSLAIVSIFLVPILYIVCFPSRKWVKKETEKFSSF